MDTPTPAAPTKTTSNATLSGYFQLPFSDGVSKDFYGFFSGLAPNNKVFK